MKHFTSSLCMLLLLIFAFFVQSCKDEYDDVAPGSYINTKRIETFPGDRVTVTGTASNGSAIQSVSLICEAWGIHHVYDRSSYEDKVFNYEYQFTVPDKAEFNQSLTVTVLCKNGKTTTQKIPLTFLPDTSAPTVTPGFNEQVGVDFDTKLGLGVWDLSFEASDDRDLKSVNISIPACSYNKTIEASGKSLSVKETINFTAAGSYPCTITIEDLSGNRLIGQVEIMVMLQEHEEPIQDYPGMYVIDANENPEDYIDGYYRWMDRKGEYQYEGKFYAATDNAKIFFTPERNLDGDLYGVSPYVSSKLMNNNGYVVPLTIAEAGYYGIWIDLKAHTYSIWPLEKPTNAYVGTLRTSGTGFTFGDWGTPADDMIKISEYRYQYSTSLVEGYNGTYQYYFYSPDWAHVFRADTEGKWWYESASGSCAVFNTTYSGKVIVTFDTAYPWGTIKKDK